LGNLKSDFYKTNFADLVPFLSYIVDVFYAPSHSNFTLSPAEESDEIALLHLHELGADCLFCPARIWFLPHTMPRDSPTKTSKEIHVEMHPVQ